jgi:hypothetical protein
VILLGKWRFLIVFFTELLANVLSHNCSFNSHFACANISALIFTLYAECVPGELNANRPVPFRLTPNIAEFLTAIGVTGPLTAAMLVTARCLAYPQYRVSSFLAAVLRDEYITWHKKVRCLALLALLLMDKLVKWNIYDECFYNLCNSRVCWVIYRMLVVVHEVQEVQFHWCIVKMCLKNLRWYVQRFLRSLDRCVRSFGKMYGCNWVEPCVK